MATSIEIQVNTVTETSISISMIVNVTYAANYYIRYGIEGNDGTDETYTSSTFYLSDGGYTGNPYKNFTGLTPSTRYYIWCSLYNADNGNELGIEDYVYETTEASEPVAETYYAELILNGNGGTYNGSSTITFDTPGFMAGWDGYADVPVDYDGSDFTRSGYTLLGFSTSRSASYANYNIEGTYYVRSTSTSSRNPDSEILYAVWSNSRPSNWSWTSTVAQGYTLNLTATEWNNFISRIQEFASYRGVSLNSSYLNNAYATRGTTMLASQANAVRYLVNQLSPPTSVPSTVSSGSLITAAFVNGLKNSLNSIP